MNKRWEEKLGRMKIKKRNLINEKRKEIISAMKKKNETTNKLLDQYKSQKESMNKQKLQKSIQNEKIIRKNIEEHFHKLEIKRLEEEQRNKERSKNI